MAGPTPLDGTELGDLLEDLTDGSNIHPGIRLIADGIRAIAEDTTLTPAATQLLLAQLCGTDVDTVHAIAHLAARLTHPDTNPALRHLPADVRKTAQHQGELAAYHLADPDLRDPAATACAALDHTDRVERGCTDMDGLTDEQRKELSRKNAEKNRQSINRPR